ncbi:MAG: hypothetical protein L0Z51_00960 [Candidatus Latescibacteria bacterium]|nr:hypothetical protein [Candidatus Latescibacterota bacterium]MCI0531098.1 hypothetical protein [candidate division Zixibacteria bacterium]
MEFKKGDLVGVPCTTKPSPFPGERMVGIETKKGPISGFIREDDLLEIKGVPHVRGIVVGFLEDTVFVEVRGSYFTTTGLAEFEKIWASENLQKAA